MRFLTVFFLVVGLAACGSVKPPEPPQPKSDVPFYGEWAWAAKTEDGDTMEGYTSISDILPSPMPEHVKRGGLGAWTFCAGDPDTCEQPSGVGHVDVVDYGKGDQFDIVFVSADGGTRFVGFDDDDKLGNEVDGAPTLKGGGAWFSEDGDSVNTTFAMVKIADDPARALDAAVGAVGAP